MTKADRLAADRLLKAAVRDAIDRIRVGQEHAEVAANLQVAGLAAGLLLRETA